MSAIIFKEAILVVICHGLVWCLEAAYGLIFIHKKIFNVRFAAGLSGSGRIFIQGLPIGAAMLLLTVPYQGPLIFFRHFTSADDSLGQLALAMQVLFMLSNIPLALGSASLPVLSRAAARKDGKDRMFAETMLRYSVLLGTVLALLGTAFGPWLTTLIFGAKFSQAGYLVGPVLWLMIPWAAGHALTRVMMAGRFDYQTLVAAAIGAIFFSLAIRVAILRYEAMGALWCAGVSMALPTLYLTIFLHRNLAIDLQSSLIRPSLAVLSAVGLFYVLNPFGVIVSFIGSLSIFAIGCYMLTCLTPQDIMWFGQIYRWFADKLFLRA
jgi:O-antigen/teichoic acid export membrane protein